MTDDEQTTLRDALIAHAEARALVSVRNDNNGAACVVIGYVVKVTDRHVIMAGQRPGDTSRVPIDTVTLVTVLGGKEGA